MTWNFIDKRIDILSMSYLLVEMRSCCFKDWEQVVEEDFEYINRLPSRQIAFKLRKLREKLNFLQADLKNSPQNLLNLTLNLSFSTQIHETFKNLPKFGSFKKLQSKYYPKFHGKLDDNQITSKNFHLPSWAAILKFR